MGFNSGFKVLIQKRVNFTSYFLAFPHLQLENQEQSIWLKIDLFIILIGLLLFHICSLKVTD